MPERLLFGLTDHVEGPANRPSAEIYDEVAEVVRQADALGIDFAWFSEHHAHVHLGHLPTPLLFALHLASHTDRIRLGTAIICLNLHHATGVAEQVAVADTLTGGRTAIGFGSGSSPEEFEMFGLEVTDAEVRHRRFRQSLIQIQASWRELLPNAAPDLTGRSWLAVNSVGSARIAGELGFNVLFSHLRTVEQYREYRDAYAEMGGRGLVAPNRPIYVGEDDQSAWSDAEQALRTLWRRFQKEGKIAAEVPEPADVRELCGHPINFIVGGPESVAEKIEELRSAFPFVVLNAEVRWEGLSHSQVLESLRRLAAEVRPMLAPM